jgi:hypothetical protein
LGKFSIGVLLSLFSEDGFEKLRRMADFVPLVFGFNLFDVVVSE